MRAQTGFRRVDAQRRPVIIPLAGLFAWFLSCRRALLGGLNSFLADRTEVRRSSDDFSPVNSGDAGAVRWELRLAWGLQVLFLYTCDSIG